MGRTYPVRKHPKKPKKPPSLALGCLLVAFLATISVQAGDYAYQSGKDQYKPGDMDFRLIGAYGSQWDIPGSGESYSVPPKLPPIVPPPPPVTPPPPKCHDDGNGKCKGHGNDHFLGAAFAAPEAYGYGNEQQTKNGQVGLGFSYFLAEDVSLEFTGTMPTGDAGSDNLSLSAGLDYFFGHFYIPMEVKYWGELDEVGIATGGGLDYRVGKATILRGQLTGNYVESDWGWQLGASVGWLLGD